MRRWGWIAAVLVLAGLGWLAWSRWLGAPPEQQYKTAQIERGDLSEVITANGTINPVRVVNVGTQVSGTVAKIYADFNDKVCAGELLLEIDRSVYAARLAASEASLANIRATAALQAANAKRAEELFRQNYISRQDYETQTASARGAAAQVAQAEAQIRQDRANVGFTEIRSPVSGVVISRQVDVGQTVAASFNTPTLFTIARDLQRMQIEAAVAEADIARVKVGQRVDFTVDAYGARQFAGTVAQIRLNPTTQQNVVTYTVVVAVANPDGALLPGMTANASFRVAEHKDVLLIPNAALSFKPKDWTPQRSGERRKPGSNPDALTVFVLKDGKPEPVRITIGASDSDYSELTGGPLSQGSTVVTGTIEKPKSGGFGPPEQPKRGQ